MLQLADLISIRYCHHAHFIVNEKYELRSKDINCLYLILKIINQICQSFFFFFFKHIILWNSEGGFVTLLTLFLSIIFFQNGYNCSGTLKTKSCHSIPVLEEEEKEED